MTSRIINALATTDALAAVFADEAVVQAMLDVEVALARACARAGVIPKEAVDPIARAARAESFDAAVIARAARASGTPGLPLVAALTERVRAGDAAAARFVHWGATSQDVVDTAVVLLVNRAAAVLAADHARLCGLLRALSDRHAGDVMLGRTLLQPAPPVTFGLKVAGWLAAAARSWTRVTRARADACVLEFGGASGTLAALGDRGLTVAEALAVELALPNPAAPWHAHRDRLAALVSAAGIYTGVLGKIARDLSLLMQTEVAEAAERGGASSTLPHKRNPAGAAAVLAAAVRMPGIVSAALTSLVQEHERGVGGWHAELPIVADGLQTTGAALAAMCDALDGLSVDPDRMRANIDRTNGAVFAERAMMRAGASMGRDRAHRILTDALARARSGGESLARALQSAPEVAAMFSEDELRTIGEAESYLGMAETFRRRLLAAADSE